jgi:hypothetical protein
MKTKQMLLAAMTVAGLSSAALADGFSATLETPISLSPVQFTVGGSLNYSIEALTNLFVGGSVGGAYNFSSGVGAIGARVGTVYVTQLIDAPDTFVNAYIGAGANLLFLPATSTVSFAADVNGGLFARYGISDGIRIYGGVDAEAGFNFVSSSFVPAVSGYGGVRFETLPNAILYLQGGVGFNNIKAANASGSSLTSLPAALNTVVYDVRAGLYYQFAPQFQLGVYGAFNGGFTIGLTAKFLEKPGTLGIAGNYLP